MPMSIVRCFEWALADCLNRHYKIPVPLLDAESHKDYSFVEVTFFYYRLFGGRRVS